MQVKGKIMNQEVVSLIDSKSTHNFLDSTKLPALQLQLDTSKILEVKVANGSIIKTLGVYHGFVILIQGNRIVVDFNVLHWEGGGGGAMQWFLVHWFLQGLHPSRSTLLDADKLFGNFVKKGLVLHIETISTSSPSQPPTNCCTVRFAGSIF